MKSTIQMSETPSRFACLDTTPAMAPLTAPAATAVAAPPAASAALVTAAAAPMIGMRTGGAGQGWIRRATANAEMAAMVWAFILAA